MIGPGDKVTVDGFDEKEFSVTGITSDHKFQNGRRENAATVSFTAKGYKAWMIVPVRKLEIIED